MFGRATITLGISPHSSLAFYAVIFSTEWQRNNVDVVSYVAAFT